MIDRYLINCGTYNRPLHAPRLKSSATFLAMDVIRASSRTLRTLEGISEECTLPSLAVDSLSAQLRFEQNTTTFGTTTTPFVGACTAAWFS